MSGDDNEQVERELQELFRRMPAPDPSGRLRLAVKADRAPATPAAPPRRRPGWRLVGVLELAAALVIGAVLLSMTFARMGQSPAAASGSPSSPAAVVPSTHPTAAPSAAETATPGPTAEAPSPTAAPPSPAPPRPVAGIGSFSSTSMNMQAAAFALLADGRVLLVGNTGAEIYDPAADRVTLVGDPSTVHPSGTATRLADGRVLLAGGTDGWVAYDSAELFDPATGTFAATGKMTIARSGQAAALLPDGRVLIAGGQTFHMTPPATPARTATPGGPSKTGFMTRGQPLFDAAPGSGVAAGRGEPAYSTGPALLRTAEVYDPATGKFTRTGSMSASRCFFTLTTLGSGRVLAVGGGGEVSAGRGLAELYNPATGTFSRTGSLHKARYAQNTTLLPDGRVLISAGNDGNDAVTQLEIYDPNRGTFANAGTSGKRGFFGAALIGDGRVLFVGGIPMTDRVKVAMDLKTSDIYDPATGTLTPGPELQRIAGVASGLSLPDGRVLVMAGVADQMGGEIYTP